MASEVSFLRTMSKRATRLKLNPHSNFIIYFLYVQPALSSLPFYALQQQGKIPQSKDTCEIVFNKREYM